MSILLTYYYLGLVPVTAEPSVSRPKNTKQRVRYVNSYFVSTGYYNLGQVYPRTHSRSSYILRKRPNTLFVTVIELPPIIVTGVASSLSGQMQAATTVTVDSTALADSSPGIAQSTLAIEINLLARSSGCPGFTLVTSDAAVVIAAAGVGDSETGQLTGAATTGLTLTGDAAGYTPSGFIVLSHARVATQGESVSYAHLGYSASELTLTVTGDLVGREVSGTTMSTMVVGLTGVTILGYTASGATYAAATPGVTLLGQLISGAGSTAGPIAIAVTLLTLITGGPAVLIGASDTANFVTGMLTGSAGYLTLTVNVSVVGELLNVADSGYLVGADAAAIIRGTCVSYSYSGQLVATTTVADTVASISEAAAGYTHIATAVAAGLGGQAVSASGVISSLVAVALSATVTAYELPATIAGFTVIDATGILVSGRLHSLPAATVIAARVTTGGAAVVFSLPGYSVGESLVGLLANVTAYAIPGGASGGILVQAEGILVSSLIYSLPAVTAITAVVSITGTVITASVSGYLTGESLAGLTATVAALALPAYTAGDTAVFVSGMGVFTVPQAMTQSVLDVRVQIASYAWGSPGVVDGVARILSGLGRAIFVSQIFISRVIKK